MSPKGYRPDTWKRRAGKWQQQELPVPGPEVEQPVTDWELLALIESARENLTAALGLPSPFEAQLRAALKALAEIKTGKPGPKPLCMCGPCVKHRAADRRWRRANNDWMLEYNRNFRAAKQNGGARPGEPTDEELDRRASDWLRASGV